MWKRRTEEVRGYLSSHLLMSQLQQLRAIKAGKSNRKESKVKNTTVNIKEKHHLGSQAAGEKRREKKLGKEHIKV